MPDGSKRCSGDDCVWFLVEPGGDHDGEVAGQGVALSPDLADIRHDGKVVMEAAQGPGIGECGLLVTLLGVGD